MEERDGFIHLVVGGRRSGKSVHSLLKIKKICETLKKVNRKPKVLVIDSIDNQLYRKEFLIIDGKRIDLPKIQTLKTPAELIGWKSGVKRVLVQKFEDIGPYLISGYCNNSFIVIEDAKRYFNSNLKMGMDTILIDSKNIGVSILLNFHSFRQVPPKIIDFTNIITVKKTNEDIKSVKAKVSFTEIHDAFKRAQASDNNFYEETIVVSDFM